MKKFLMLTLLLLLALSTTTTASSLDYFYSDIVDTAEINYLPQQGELEYLLTPFEYNFGRPSEDGIEQQFAVKFGLAPQTQLRGDLNYQVNSLNLNLYLKHRFYQYNGWVLAGQFHNNYYSRLGTGVNTPGLTLITEKKLDPSLTLHNNFKLSFARGGTTRTMENGFSYCFTENHTLKAVLTTSTIDDLNRTDIAVALKSRLTDQLTYTGYLSPSENDLELYNLLDYQLRPDLTISGLYQIYNPDLKNSYFTAGLSKEIDKNLTVKGSYRIELEENGRKELKVGFDYKF